MTEKTTIAKQEVSDEDTYKKISMKDNGPDLATITNAKGSDKTKREENINSNCKLQLNQENYDKLKTQLIEKLEKIKKVVNEKNSEKISNSKEEIKKLIKNIKTDKLQDISNKIITQAKELENVGKDDKSIDESIDSINFKEKYDIMAKSEKNTIKIIDDYKSIIKKINKEIDQLQDSATNAFNDVEKTISTAQKGRIDYNTQITNIELKNIEGFVYVPEHLKNLTASITTKLKSLSKNPDKKDSEPNKPKLVKCNIISVNAKDKTYTAQEINGKGIFKNIKDICLVHNSKIE